MSLLRFLGLKTDSAERPEGPSATATVRQIVQKLENLPEDRARYTACFAYILSRVAHADMEISAEETGAMEAIVMEKGEMPEEQAMIVVQMAKTQALLFGGTENFLVVREFNAIATREQKLALIHCLFAVSASDKTVSSVEDNVIRQIASELLLDHSEFVAVRSRFREHLGVLKKPED